MWANSAGTECFFAVAGTGIESKGQASYDENVAAVSALAFERGHELMRWFLN